MWRKKSRDMFSDKDREQTSYKQDVERNDSNPDEQRAADGGDNLSDDGSLGGDKSSDMADETATREAQEWKDKYMRLSAEFDNYRKRTLKEKMDLIASGGEDVIKAMLPVIDDIERALSAMESAMDVESARTGVALIAQKLKDTLQTKGVQEIESLGAALDTDLHEAIAKISTEKGKKGKIVDVVQKGYKLGDKVIRHAKVVVGE
jgi:molecular chaperone GrpE